MFKAKETFPQRLFKYLPTHCLSFITLIHIGLKECKQQLAILCCQKTHFTQLFKSHDDDDDDDNDDS